MEINTTDLTSYTEEYTEFKFWAKVKSIARKAGRNILYYALILFFVMKSGDVSPRNKAIIIGALGYLIVPLDLIPDYIPGLGLTDDLAALKLAFDTVKDSVTPEIEAQVESKLAEWF